MLKPSIVAAGLDPESLPARGTIVGRDFDVTARGQAPETLVRYLERRARDVRGSR